MDAVPISFEQELNVWEEQVRASQSQIDLSCEEISYLPIGGTAIGTGINSPKKFSRNVCQELNKIYSEMKIKFKPLEIKGEMMSSQNHILTLSSALTRYASTLLKIANDIRWMNSGPISGLSEITLKALQPGSSIMPGKVNPVIPEAVSMASADVIGNDVTITVASQSGNFQLNVMLPVIAYNLLKSINLLSGAMGVLSNKAIKNFKINKRNLEASLSKNPILVTALNPIIGYEKAAYIAKKAYKESRPIIEVAAEETDLSESKLKKLLDPSKLSKGGI